MVCGGKEFPDTPAGYLMAADHVESLSPLFWDDACSLRDHASTLQRVETLRKWVRVAGVIVIAAWAILHVAQKWA
jgi:hypothetical protein